MYSLYFDGASKGNPGPSGCGGIIIDHNSNKKQSVTFTNYLGNETNNYAEYMGLYYGMLKAIEIKADNLEVIGDSKLVISQCNGVYQVKSKKLKKIYDKIKTLEENFESISYIHVYRENNKIADKLANDAIKYLNTSIHY